MASVTLRAGAADRLCSELSLGTELARALATDAWQAPVELTRDEAGRFCVRSRFVPPLLCGFDRLEVPRSLAETLRAKRHLASSTTNQQLASHLVLAAFGALGPLLGNGVRVFVTDACVESDTASFRDGDLLTVCDVVEAVALGIRGSLARQPVPAWRAAVAQTWAALGSEPGVSFDAAELRLRLERGGARAEGLVEQEGAVLFTCVHVLLAGPPALAPDETSAWSALTGLACEVRVEESGLRISRLGLVANAAEMMAVLEASLALAREIVSRPGPYR